MVHPEVKHCLLSNESRLLAFGHMIEWIEIEMICFVSFFFTMVIILIKSRFVPVGVDQQD